MNNAIQWVYLGIGVLAVLLPIMIVGVLRPWRRMGPGWRSGIWGLAIGTGLVVGSFMYAMILGSGGDLEGRPRVGPLNELVAAVGPIPGILLFAGSLITTTVVVAWTSRSRRLPAQLDMVSVRTLARRGVPAEQLRAEYRPSVNLAQEQFEIALELGRADRDATVLRGRVIAYAPRSFRGNDALFRRVADLETTIRAATTIDEVKPALSELASIASRVEAGERLTI